MTNRKRKQKPQEDEPVDHAITSLETGEEISEEEKASLRTLEFAPSVAEELEEAGISVAETSRSHEEGGEQQARVTLLGRFLTIALLGLLLVPSQSEARECARYGIRYVQREWPLYSYRERYCVRWHENFTYRLPEGETYSYLPPRWNDDEDRRSGRHCREVRKAVGDQHLTTEGAKKAANEAWAATVRFHLGEKWIDLNNARHIVYTCSRSSIKEAGASVTTLGQALNRCELQAIPCAPLPEKEGREER